jgi:phenylpropionate dioxygenase-like ring-hydroxylating dioxygenase large terminal subunit
MTALPGRWYAIAAEHDVPQRHVYRTTLGGHELAAWRSRDGAIQVWDNRCPHRGVRLSLGEVVGNELRCQYHAWRFATTGACTFIPAQPDLKVPRTIRATPWPVAQAGGLIWTGIDPQGTPPALADGAVVRAVGIGRATAVVEPALAQIERAGLSLTLQPLDQASTMIRGTVGDGDLARADRVLLALRRELERAA